MHNEFVGLYTPALLQMNIVTIYGNPLISQIHYTI